MKRYFVVLNPVSGTLDLRTVVLLLSKYYKEDFVLYTTTEHEPLKRKVIDAVRRGYQMIVAIGGDGTVSDAAEALLHSKVPLAIVPTGTANNLARELGIPTNVEEAIALSTKKHRIRTIDAMKIGKRHYFLDVSIGTRSEAIQKTKRDEKMMFGMLAYVIRGLRQLFLFTPTQFLITADNKKAQYTAIEVVIANAGIVGIPAFRYAKHIQIDDGKLNVCIINAHTITEYLKVGYRFLMNKRVAQEHVQFLTATDLIDIATDAHIPVQADGEIIGKGKVQVRLARRAVRVVVLK